MQVVLFISLLTAVTCETPVYDYDPELDIYWKEFKKTYGKIYSPDEEGIRRIIWEEKVAEVVRHNLYADLRNLSYSKGLNEYSDLSFSEQLKFLNGYKRNETTQTFGSTYVKPLNVLIPDHVDWRKEGYVTPIKNQKLCGSCWAFSSTGALEGQHKRKTEKLISLSEQNLVDCVTENGGCSGGWMDTAFEYVKGNNGIDTEESYPYTAKTGTCHFDRTSVGGTCTGYVDIPSGDEKALKEAVATVGPLSVALDASHESFFSYKSGIYDETECKSTIHSHAMLVVGYGTKSGRDYWLLKNSWGESWGMKGYMMMPRNQNNHCGIASHASYPLV